MPRNRFASVQGILVVAGVLATLAPAAHAQICTPFTDVAAADDFCGSIQWIYNRGITLGCTTNQYCPAQLVRRDQMAAFIVRLGNVVHQQGGNAFEATGVIGTTDGHPLDIRVNNERVMRYEPNTTSPNVIGGSPGNSVTPGVRGATIAGGGLPAGDTDPDFHLEAPHRVTDAYGTVGGGYANMAGDDAGTTIDSSHATVSGGYRNRAMGHSSYLGGGEFNTASGPASSISGGSSNVASAVASAVLGGSQNEAIGAFGSVVGGQQNVALGDYSFAAGRRAKANSDGCFVWADSTNADISCGSANLFLVRSTGGVVIRTNAALTAGVNLPAGGNSWAPVSDRAVKDNVQPVDARAVLERLLDVPIATWNYLSQAPEIRHMGSMAQDFREAFGLGIDDKTITQVDVNGVTLAAIQGLNRKLETERAAKDAKIAALRSESDALKRELADLRLAVEVLRARTSAEGRVPETR